MHTIVLNVNDNVYKHFMYFLKNSQKDIKIMENREILDIEEIKSDDKDYKYIQKKRDKKDYIEFEDVN